MDNYIEKIQDILVETGWSQTRFAAEIGVTFATVNRWLKAHTKPHSAQLRQIDKLFDNIIGIIPLPEEKIVRILKAVDTKNKKLSNIKTLLRREDIAQDFLLELTYNSDAIEGSTLTKRQAEAVIFDKATIKDKSLVEHLEAINHSTILRNIFDGTIGGPINESLIKYMHKVLMQGIREDAGEYARHQRAIRGFELVLPHPSDIPEEMGIFNNKVNIYKGYPLGHIAKMHADFEAIHPFGDGNGRIGRLIMIIQLIDKGFAPCIINVKEKADYYKFLEYAQKKSDTHLVYFLAESVLNSYKLIERYI